MPNSDRLTSKQRKAVAALLTSPDVETAAKVVGVSRRTLFRWLKDSQFREAITSAELDAIDQATRQLAGLEAEAIRTIQEVMCNSADGVRLRAAATLLDESRQHRESRDFEARLVALEEKINAKR